MEGADPRPTDVWNPGSCAPCSERDFARHICQDAALYFNPLDADSVARSMARVMEDGELRARLAQNGKRLISQSPTWDEIAAQFVSVLEQAAGRCP